MEREIPIDKNDQLMRRNAVTSLQQYVYHLARTDVVVQIKIHGMQSTFERTRSTKADPHGAFAQDRDKKLPQKIQEKLRALFLELLALGYDRQQIESNQGLGIYRPFGFDPTGGDDDWPQEDFHVKAVMAEYKQSLGQPHHKPLNPGQRRAELDKWTPRPRDPGVKPEVQYLLDFPTLHPNHCLVHLATARAAYHYRREEVITTQHIYFFLEKDAKSCYDDYTQHLNDSHLVVLRVFNDGSLGLDADLSEGRAVRTKQRVPPEKLQVLADTSRFTDEGYRKDARNWQALTNWNP